MMSTRRLLAEAAHTILVTHRALVHHGEVGRLRKIGHFRCAVFRGVSLLALLAVFGATHAGETRSWMFDARWSSMAEPVFRRIGTEVDFSETLAIAQDARGFIWIGTQHGLIRWDGYRSRVYQADFSDPNALHDAYIGSLYADDSGSLWIGTRSSGLAEYDAANERFSSYRVGGGGIPYPVITAITGDHQGHVWVASQIDNGPASVDRLDTATGEVQTLVSSKDGKEVRARALLVDSDGTLWIGTLGGLLRCEKKTECREVNFAASPQIRSLYESADKTLFIGTLDDGVFFLSPGSNEARPLVNAKIRSIFDFAEPVPGELWIASFYDGLFVVDRATGRIRHVQHNRAIATSLPDDLLTKLLRDRSGLIWVGSVAGLATYDPQSAILTVPGGSIRPENSNDTWVNVLFAAGNGKIWAGTANEGVYLIDPRGGPAHHIAPAQLRSEVSGIAEANGSIFVVDNDGLARITADGRNVERFSLRPRRTTAITNGVAVTGNKVWLLGFDGLWSLDASAGTDVPVLRSAFSDRLSNQALTKALWQTPTLLWLGTRDGLNRVDMNSDTVTKIMAAPGVPSALQNGSIKSLLIDRRQRLWVAAATALHRVKSADAPQLSFEAVRLGDLQTPTILAQVLAEDGTIWVSTTDGLVTVDADTLATRVLQRAEGVVMQFRTDDDVCTTSQGELLFGGIDGITVVRPDRLHPRDFHAPVVVTDLRVDGQRVTTRHYDPETHEYERLILAADDHRLSVEFASLDYAAPERSRYAYRLEGFDRDWINADTSGRTANYTDLPPGDFKLFLRGSDGNGNWSNQDIVIPIRVLPPWYRTIWASAAYVAAFVAALWLAGTWRVRRAERTTRILEKTVTERTTALATANAKLEDARQAAEAATEAKSAFLANMSHEIRTPMNAVLGFAQLGLRQPLQAKTLDYLRKIADAGQNLLGIINDILDFSKIESGRLTLERAPFDIRRLLDQVRDLFSARAAQQRLEFSIACESDVPDLIVGDSLRLSQVLINLVGNAMKFTQEGFVRVRITNRQLSEDTATLHFSIEDSGIGMNEAQRAQLFIPFSQADSSTTRLYGGTGLGLTISQRIVEQMGGRIDVRSIRGIGSTFEFDASFGAASVPDKEESLAAPVGSNSLAAGTRVLLAEDNPINQEIAAEILGDAGATVVIASTGDEAVYLATHEHFDCILMDIQMPGMDGHEATARIRQYGGRSDMPIIAMTAHASATFRAECLAAGMNDYITKPIDARLLIDTVLRWTRAAP